MPLRVKCRCGQELVLHFNEWVYALIGLLVLCLLVNGTALVFIASSLSSIRAQPVPLKTETAAAPASPAETREEPPAEPEALAAGNPSERSAASARQGEPQKGDGRQAEPRGQPPSEGPSPPPEAPRPGPQEAGAPGEAAHPAILEKSAGEERQKPAVSSGSAGGGASGPRPAPWKEPASAAGDSRPPPAPEKAPRSEKAAEPEKTAPPEKAAPAEAARPAPPSPPAGTPQPLVLLPGAGGLVRLLVLNRSQDPRLTAAFLLDGDPVVRRFAIKRNLQGAPPSERAALRDLLAVALPAAPLVLKETEGRNLLRRLTGQDRGPDPATWWQWGREALGIDPQGGVPAEAVTLIEARATALRSTSAAVQAIEKALARPEGKRETDLLVCIDITESMEEPLAGLSKEGWLFKALSWAVPGLRAGLLFYDDEVTGTLPLGSEPQVLARAVEGLKARGGGDVPEGVHEALKAALQLGRFEWRPGAAKQIVFVGDGPPPRGEVPALLSLARECRSEGGYSIHAISVNPTEGRPTLHFPELAEAGGGRALIARNDRIAEEIFLAIVPREARDELIPLLPELGSLPLPEARPPAPARPVPR
jgi:hypothetical protein